MGHRRSISIFWIWGLVLGAASGSSPAGGAPAEVPAALLLVLDASGSMWGQVEGENKIVIARRVLGGLVDGLDDGSEVGVIAYGHRREGDCDDIETVVPRGALDRAALKATVGRLDPKGKTPITRAIRTAFDSLTAAGGGATVILVSDGLETCGGDPCAEVRAAKQRGIDFRLHVVGFDVAREDVSQLECAAQAGDGLFLTAGNADELAGALDRAVALAPAVPAGRLQVGVVADGELQDAAVLVSDAASGEVVGGGRTYASPGTNPRVIPLPDGVFDVQVRAVGIRGDSTRRLRVEIAEGGLVEEAVDFSTGELAVGVTRNGERSDATYSVRLPGADEVVASGRTYTGESSNPARVRLTSGTYTVAIGSVEISGRPSASLGEVTLEPGGSAAVAHDWQTGTLRVGAARGGELVDATLSIVRTATGEAVGAGRTYTSAGSNPKTFVLLPGDHRVTVGEIRGERRTVEVTVVAGEVVELMVDPAGG